MTASAQAGAVETPPQTLLRLKHISKQFGGAPVLQDVSLDVLAGEVHALAGENGAGKSTLMNIVGGVLPADSGSMEWEGRVLTVANPRARQDLGISFVHQELALVPQLSVAENVFLGRHPTHGMRLVNWAELRERTREILAELGQEIDPRRPLEALSIGERQLVEIARALACVSRLIIMDEPTAPLSGRETERLFEVLRRLRQRGVSIIYITHRLKEIYELADRVTVLRDGRRVVTEPVSAIPPDLLVRHMVGRELSQDSGAPPDSVRPEVALRVDGLSRGREFRGIHLEVRKGEIVALAGLVGAGRTEILESIFGIVPAEGGRIYVGDREVAIRSPRDAIRAGIALVPDDRKGKGLVLGASVRTNAVLASERRFLIRSRQELRETQRMIGELHVRTRGADAPVGQLSGGNQQKVVLAKWLLTAAGVVLMDEPTRGVDVGAKAEIYGLIRGLAERGAAILFASSEMEEVLRLADRVVVIHRGRIAGELNRDQLCDERIMRLATGAEA